MVETTGLTLLLLEVEEGGGGGGDARLSLALIAAAAFVIPLVARRLRLPAVVLEIMFGVLIGPEVLDLVARTELLDFLAEFGLFLLMFLAGFEIDFGRLQRQGPRQVLMGLVVVAVILVAAYSGTGLLDLAEVDQRIFLTLLISSAALGLVVPTLRATRRSATPSGQIALITTVLAETIALVGVVVFLVVEEQGLNLEVLNVPALFLAIGVILFLVKRAAWWYPERFERLFDAHDPEELGIRATLALMFVFVGLSVALGIEPILGAFLAGALFAFVFRERGGLERQLSGFSYGFLIPIFFISVGLNFPLGRLTDGGVLGEALALIAVAIGIKLVGATVLLFRGFSTRETLGTGVLLAGQLSVIIALAGLGVERGLLSEGDEAGAILLVAVTALFTPLVFRWLQPPLPEQAEGERRQLGDGALEVVELD